MRFLTLGRDVVKNIMKAIKKDISDKICQIHIYHDKSNSEVKYCVAKIKSNSKTEILIEKEHEIYLEWIKKLTHGNGNYGYFNDISTVHHENETFSVPLASVEQKDVSPIISHRLDHAPETIFSIEWYAGFAIFL